MVDARRVRISNDQIDVPATVVSPWDGPSMTETLIIVEQEKDQTARGQSHLEHANTNLDSPSAYR